MKPQSLADLWEDIEELTNEIIPEAAVLSDGFPASGTEISTYFDHSKMLFTASVEAVVNHMRPAVGTQWWKWPAKYSLCGKLEVVGVITEYIRKPFTIRKIYQVKVYVGHWRAPQGTSLQWLKTFGRMYPASNFITGKVDCAQTCTEMHVTVTMYTEKPACSDGCVCSVCCFTTLYLISKNIF